MNHAEFVYNNSDHASLGVSLFFAMYRYYPRTDINVKDNVLGEKILVATERVK